MFKSRKELYKSRREVQLREEAQISSRAVANKSSTVEEGTSSKYRPAQYKPEQRQAGKLVKVKPAQIYEQSDLNTRLYDDCFSVFKSICLCCPLKYGAYVLKLKKACNKLKYKGRKVQQCQNTFQRLLIFVQRTNPHSEYLSARIAQPAECWKYCDTNQAAGLCVVGY
ncbi:hypothetical protein F511_42794 [Dorcoceras hygrometricum]|uniref:Uncharacterized protein n=1 Tax=Dorcoceras hygrometricum TaxID=472368 RepID=A0A2Z7D2Y1_9LAMI|nr:hypothetical protein F511_42794 [Dorcoceras hygrometricum]